MQIIDFDLQNQDWITQIANLLVIGFELSWPDLTSAAEEVQHCLQPANINRIALSSKQNVIGWISGQPTYEGLVWELHPLIVHPDFQGKGVGRALVDDFEKRVRDVGGLTITLGTDDEANQTSLANVDVYPNVLENLENIQNLNRHPYEFYQKIGFVIVGMIPDANGFGKPDIIMAKRVTS